LQIKTAADDQADARGLGGLMRPHNPASELRSTMPSAEMPSAAAEPNNSSGDDAPRRKE